MTTKREQRQDRVPVGGPRDILSVPNQDPNYVYRWVRDDMGRIDQFKAGGYEVVERGHRVGESTVDKGTRLGTAYTMSRGTATLVLMRIPKEWYDEDQAAKQGQVDALDSAMKQETKTMGYGQVITTSSK